MSEVDTTNSVKWWDGLIEMQPQQLGQIAFVGIVTGAVLWLMTMLIHQVVLIPLFCGNPASSACVGATNTSGVIAAIFAAVVGLMGLVRMSVYRPLLIVLAAAVSLWGLAGWLADAPWYEALAWSIILYGLAYATFAWLVRPRAFGPAVAIVVIVVLLARVAAV